MNFQVVQKGTTLELVALPLLSLLGPGSEGQPKASDACRRSGGGGSGENFPRRLGKLSRWAATGGGGGVINQSHHPRSTPARDTAAAWRRVFIYIALSLSLPGFFHALCCTESQSDDKGRELGQHQGPMAKVTPQESVL